MLDATARQQLDRTVHFISLGCARNLVDSEVMMGQLLAHGWQFTPSATHADAVVVNTCGFIDSAVKESIDRIIEVGTNKPAHQKLIVAGCLTQRYKHRLKEGLPEVDLFIGTDQFHRIAEFLNAPPLRDKVHAARNNYIYSADAPRINTLARGSAYVKVSEGCQHRCSFCIIPAIRGPLRSRPISDIVCETEQLVAQGVIEIILIAQDLAAFGREHGDHDLLALLQALAAVPGLRWIRPLYIYPEHISDAFLDFFAHEDKIVKYLDIPVQHANDRILRLMRRAVDRRGLEKILQRVRRHVPRVALRTSVMVGFPSEQENDFHELLDFIATQEFDHLGCFTYAREQNTAAARLPGQIAAPIKQQRQRQIMTLQRKISRQKLQHQIGTIQDVLLERKASEHYIGRTAAQAPEVDGVVYVTGETKIPPCGNLIRAQINAASTYDLIATAEGSETRGAAPYPANFLKEMGSKTK